jgi:cysteine-rich repeat protein
MASLSTLRSAALGLSLFGLLGAPGFATADCPEGSGIEFPFLTDSQFECQRNTFNATVDYFNSFINARQDCFSKELQHVYPPGELNCLQAITNDEPGTTGDDETDRRLRAAEAAITRRILTHCTNVDLSVLGFPGFCNDATPLTPYNAFDHNLCLLNRVKELGTFILDVEHPPAPQLPQDFFNIAQTYCLEQTARLSSHLTTSEFEFRGRCLLAQMQRNIELPPEIDCRREVDPQDPQTGRLFTDNNVVEAHNHVLRTLPNSCPAIDLEEIGFPHRCEFRDANSVFPLPALTECMFEFHHHDIFRLIDLIFPCSTKCGNGFLNVEEECDDGDNDWMEGEFCRRDCSRVDCGDPDDDGDRDIVDALYVLRAAVGLEQCTLLVCDVTGDLRVRASDALRLLQYAVGLPVVLSCPDISVTCGNGFLEEKETCDDGDALYNDGEFCNSACLLVMCGDTDDSGGVTILDAQYILNAGVDNVPCDDSICDITGNGIINSTDALRALMHAVGLPIDFNCPAPPETPPAPPIE